MAIHKTAIISENAVIPSSCEIGPNVVIGENVILGENVKVIANAYLEYGHISFCKHRYSSSGFKL